MRFMSDMARYQTFDEEQFEREREVVIGELDRHESNPYGPSAEMTASVLQFHQPQEARRQPRNRAGRDDGDDAPDPERYYVPNNSAIIVTGDVTPPAVFRQVEELFADWRAPAGRTVQGVSACRAPAAPEQHRRRPDQSRAEGRPSPSAGTVRPSVRTTRRPTRRMSSPSSCGSRTRASNARSSTPAW